MAKTNITATIIIAMVAMISMTGFAMAGSTTQTYVGSGSYYTGFNGFGTGDLTILTHTSHGSDVQQTSWDNTRMGGWQMMNTAQIATTIDRKTTIGMPGNHAANPDAAGLIITQSVDNAPTGGDSVMTVATYEDDVAYTSHVTVDQTTYLIDDGNGFESAGADTLIKGHCYDGNLSTYGITGTVTAVSDGVVNSSVTATMGMAEGGMWMQTYICAADLANGDETARLIVKNMLGAGSGSAAILGGTTDQGQADFGLTVLNDGLGYTTGGSLSGNPVSVSLIDDFDNGYMATGYIYAMNI